MNELQCKYRSHKMTAAYTNVIRYYHKVMLSSYYYLSAFRLFNYLTKYKGL